MFMFVRMRVFVSVFICVCFNPCLCVRTFVCVRVSTYTWGGGGGLAGGSEAVERWVVTVLYHRVDRVCLLQLKQQLLHGLNGVVTTQVDHHLLDLEHTRKQEHTQARTDKQRVRIWDRTIQKTNPKVSTLVFSVLFYGGMVELNYLFIYFSWF